MQSINYFQVKGFQVAPAELEAVIKDHKAVFDAAVVGIPDDKAGEKPKAFVVLKNDANVSAEDIMNYVNEKVAPYKKIKEIEFLDSIQKNPTGKILRRLLVKQK